MNGPPPVVHQNIGLACRAPCRPHYGRVVQLCGCRGARRGALRLLDVLDVVDTGRDEGGVLAARDDRLV